MIIPRKVELPGHGTYWFHEEDKSGALAPLEHCDENGNIVDAETAMFSESYAYVFANGDIKRHRKVIGHYSDLKDVRNA